MPNTQPWEPILQNDLVPCAQNHVMEIAAEAAKNIYTYLRPSQLCEVAIFHAYLSIAYPTADFAEVAVECLNRVAQMLPREELQDSLYDGLAGVAWSFDHITKLLNAGELRIESDEDTVDDIDEILIRRLRGESRIRHFDLISGLAGQAVYFFERLPRKTAREALELILRHLEWQSEESGVGITWYTSPSLVHATQRAYSESGYYDLGVAHGLPGVAHVLAEMIRANIQPARAQKLLKGAMNWLDRMESPSTSQSSFSSRFVPGQPTEESRLGWCYGDLGLAAVLHDSAKLIGDIQGMAVALSRIDRTLGWPDNASKVCDAGICHGAFGIAHIYNRLYQAEQLSKYKTMANVWYQKGFSFTREDAGLPRFFAWRPDLNPNMQTDKSFLSGDLGIGLSLLAATTTIEPQWDRLLLLSSERELARS
jgi:lantibiotic biosynthesis protein